MPMRPLFRLVPDLNPTEWVRDGWWNGGWSGEIFYVYRCPVGHRVDTLHFPTLPHNCKECLE